MLLHPWLLSSFQTKVLFPVYLAIRRQLTNYTWPLSGQNQTTHKDKSYLNHHWKLLTYLCLQQDYSCQTQPICTRDSAEVYFARLNTEWQKLCWPFVPYKLETIGHSNQPGALRDLHLKFNRHSSRSVSVTICHQNRPIVKNPTGLTGNGH